MARTRPFLHAIACLAVLSLTAAAPALAQSAAVSGVMPVADSQPGHTEARPHARAMARTSLVTLDGRLDESAWQAAPAVTGFVQQDPNEGQPATQRTEVHFLFDRDALYIGARMYDTRGAAGVHGRLVRRDQQEDGDYFSVVFDTFHDHAGRTFLQVNPAGAKSDAGQASPYLDNSWDPVWDVATSVDSLGWTAEMRIPWAQLRFPKDSVQTWGMQIWRYEERTNETSMWAFWKKNEQGGPPRFGHLEGLRMEHHGRGLELLPYAVASASSVRPADPASPFAHRRQGDWRVGGEMKALLTSTLTLDATFNPDFGQVEADPAVVNLSAYETSFPEKRPFFVEGSGLFSFGGLSCYFCSNVSGMSLFYSRRIGRPPHGAAPDDALHAEEPGNTTILGAAKVTGRTASGLQVGMLDAVTSSESVRFIDAADAPGHVQVEPFTNYFVARVKRNLNSGRVRLGAIGTSVMRDLNEPSLQQLMPTHAEALGGDWDITWKSQMYHLMGNLALSSVAGDDSAMARLQRSSARYFQRPDRGARGNGLFSDGYDLSAGSLRGFGGYTRLSKDQGLVRFETAVNFRSPGFEVNDLAFLSRADYVWQNANLFLFWSKPTRWYRTLAAIAGAQHQYNFDGDRTDGQAQLYLEAQTPGYWNLSSFVIQKPSYADDRRTRGGPMVRAPGFRGYFFNLSTDYRKPVLLGVNADYIRGQDGKGNVDLGLQSRFRLASNLNLSFQPSYSRGATTQQYVQAFTDPTATSFYGRRVIFGDLVQHTLSLDTRLSATFSPTLTLEVYAQPFVASGAYSRFKEFVRPRQAATRDFAAVQVERDGQGAVTGYAIDADNNPATAPLELDNPDFNIRSLRGNAVLRWEWRPGSTLFLVWQQNRSGSETLGDFRFGRDLGAVFDEHADNVVLLKMSYWFGR